MEMMVVATRFPGLPRRVLRVSRMWVHVTILMKFARYLKTDMIAVVLRIHGIRNQLYVHAMNRHWHHRSV